MCPRRGGWTLCRRLLTGTLEHLLSGQCHRTEQYVWNKRTNLTLPWFCSSPRHLGPDLNSSGSGLGAVCWSQKPSAGCSKLIRKQEKEPCSGRNPTTPGRLALSAEQLRTTALSLGPGKEKCALQLQGQPGPHLSPVSLLLHPAHSWRCPVGTQGLPCQHGP